MSTTTRRNRLSTVQSVAWGCASELSYANLSKLASTTAYHNGEFEVGILPIIDKENTSVSASANDTCGSARVRTQQQPNLDKLENEIVEEEDTYRLPYFKACLFATILEEVIPQLRILDACNTQLRLNKTISEMVVLLADKYGVERNFAGEALDEIDPKNLNCIKYKLDKLQSDREFISQVISDTYQNICIERDFQPLTDSVNEIVRKHELLHHLAEEEHRNKMLRREAHRQLRQLRNHIKSVTYDSNSEIQALKSQVEDVELNFWSRERYVEGWQRSRTEQRLQTLYDKERVPSRATAELKRKIEEEQRVHAEIELLTTININEVLGKVEKWMAKYETDMERIDLRIQIMKNDYENILDNNQRLDETINAHAESMNNWVAFKDEREAARKHREKMNNSAIIIQAWWRGLLVRNQLGPYKPVKKKGGASKTGEKSKKKK